VLDSDLCYLNLHHQLCKRRQKSALDWACLWKSSALVQAAG